MIIKKIEERMNLSLSSYGKELSTVRTGRANPKMLDGVRVEVYGQKMPINQFIYDGFLWITLGSFGIASVDKYLSGKNKTNEEEEVEG